MEILVTGGTVFASRFTAEYFAQKGHAVTVLNRGTRPQPEGVGVLIGDRHDAKALLRGRHFDAVLDITAYNTGDVNDLLDALDDFGTYVLLSSSAVYPETLTQPFRESQQIGPNRIWGAYGTNKIEAEAALFERVPDAYAVRPPYLYGPMNNVYREAFVFECAERDLPFYLPKDGALPLQFYYISDLCRLIEKLILTKPDIHILNAGNPETISVKEWVRACYGVLGKEPQFIRVSEEIPQRSYFPFYDYAYVLDVTAQRNILPDVTPLDDGLRQAYAWWNTHREAVVRKPLFDYIAEHLQSR